jgi:hypothetical protein
LADAPNIKRFLKAVLTGREAPRVIVFVDEIEKAFAGTGTDMSGVKTEMTGTMLSWMQDRNADGTIFIGLWCKRDQESARMDRCHDSYRSRSCSKVGTLTERSWFCVSGGI